MNERVNVDLSNKVLQTREVNALFKQVVKCGLFFTVYLHRSCEVINWASEGDHIYYITCPVVNGNKPKDLVVLVSRRRPLKDG